jgi:hypothetical protein
VTKVANHVFLISSVGLLLRVICHGVALFVLSVAKRCGDVGT